MSGDSPSPGSAAPAAAASTSAATSVATRIAPALRKLRATSLTLRLVGLALVLVGGTALTVGMLSYRRARAALVTTAEARLELLARDVAQALHRELADRVADITTWAGLETMIALTYDDVDKQLAELMRQSLHGDEWLGVVGRRADGEIVAAAGTPPSLPSPEPVSARPSLRLVADRAGHTLLRLDVGVSHPRRPAERIGTLVGFLDAERLLAQVAARRVRKDAVAVELAADRSLARVSGLAGAADLRGRDVLTARAGLPPLGGIEAPGLHVVVRQPEAIALASVTALRGRLARTAVVVVLLGGIAGALVAWQLAVPIRRLTGAVEEVAARGRPQPLAALPSAGGEVGVLSDAFAAMLERLAASEREVIAQSRLALLGEVAASVAHDVRTPLSVLKTSAQLLAGPDLSEAEQRDLATIVASEADRLNRVVTDLVDLARPGTSRPSVQPVSVLVERAVAVIGPWARSQGVRLGTHGADRLAVRADPDQMQQAFLNVLHNAVQATASAGAAAVDVAWRAYDGHAVIDISDAGPGFTPDALERAGSPFFTTRRDGTGLGLAITRRIVEGHGGRVSVRNLSDGGACVTLSLPLTSESYVC